MLSLAKKTNIWGTEVAQPNATQAKTEDESGPELACLCVLCPEFLNVSNVCPLILLLTLCNVLDWVPYLFCKENKIGIPHRAKELKKDLKSK